MSAMPHAIILIVLVLVLGFSSAFEGEDEDKDELSKPSCPFHCGLLCERRGMGGDP